MRIGYAFVVGDLFHYGHLHFLNECKKYCDYLIVGVYTDKLTTSYKRTPIYTLNERLAIFKALRVVDRVVIVQNRSCVPMMRKLIQEGIKLSFLFHGSDWDAKKDPDLIVSKAYIESIGGQLIQPKYYQGRSTTAILKEIIKRYQTGQLKLKKLNQELKHFKECD